MNEKPQNSQPRENGQKKIRILIIVLAVILALAVGFLLVLLYSTSEPEISTEQTVPSTVALQESLSITEPAQTEVTEAATEPTEPPKVSELKRLHEENPDIYGWVTIEDTRIDYPLMVTPEDEEKYLYRNFEGNYDINGLPFLDKDCSVDPESDNLIFYGHNMMSGAMFRGLLEYKEESFYQKHPVITVYTLDGERTYEIIAAFEDRVYFAYEDVFKFYQFVDAENEEHFNEAISYFKEKTPYDIEASAQYGDKLLTLVTCAYHHQYGRYVVVAREVAS